MNDIYFCFCCGGPVIFRWKPPQIYHLGTGWPCWRMQQEGRCKGSGYALIPRVRPPAERQEIIEGILDLYELYEESGDFQEILRYIINLLKSDKKDCIRDVLAHIGEHNDETSRRLVDRITATRQWKTLVRDVENKYMFVKSISMKCTPIGKRPGWFTITTRVAVIGNEGKPVPPTSVRITIRRPNHATKDYSSRTDALGIAEFEIRSRQIGTYKATVKSVRQVGWRRYDAARNQMNDCTCEVP